LRPIPVLGLEVPNDRIDRYAAHLAADPDVEFLCVVMVAGAISAWMRQVSIPVGASSSATTGPSVAVEGIVVQRLGMKHKPTAIGIGGWGRHRHLGTKLTERPGAVTLYNHGVKSLGDAGHIGCFAADR
jgi:hypothetical protein